MADVRRITTRMFLVVKEDGYSQIIFSGVGFDGELRQDQSRILGSINELSRQR